MSSELLLQDAPFGPNEIAEMTAAYDAALKLRRLLDRSDPLTGLLARKIIEVRRAGVSDPAHLCARALKELGVPLPE